MVNNTTFHRYSRRQKVDYPVGYLLGRRPVKGDIGIEIEVEGNKFKKQDIPQPWAYHKDGSLRGQDNAEYVLINPITFDQVEDSIKILWKMFEDYGSVLDESNRTSVHVHLNVQGFHLNRLTSFMALYFCVEELLTAWCGEHRVGNLFCLRAQDAPSIVSKIKRFIVEDGAQPLSEGLHYAGFNAHALFKFGSVEIRTLRGATDPKVILEWIGMLRHLYDLSASFPDPRDVCDGFSGEGPIVFLEKIMGPHIDVLRNGIGYSGSQVEEAMYKGIRLAQDLCYCRDWSVYNPVEVKQDPFGRVKKPKVSASPYEIQPLSAYSTASSPSLYQQALQTFANAAQSALTATPVSAMPDWAILDDEVNDDDN